ncbi:MAG: hypothetical protein COU33_05255 [Candidatus Magasanikbacteria bacterium CG10_big_fil_rev_8_21_14_0_10_43_6]|uniref:Uncharacterized protein n=1 Tax=Candidatus Magasanikbacteria bacterium CG10_big_fil_rev_8_21_14_0_10_43_6 TaxID=1974650 RepID=A0A2M6VZS8_9BACT|nr:MAG: hypothetical protein COU33_05255 [Candidatus Magasanikbacteria bacterium CG10_big_fil_rev_8_21_14_0_10_43_6]
MGEFQLPERLRDGIGMTLDEGRAEIKRRREQERRTLLGEKMRGLKISLGITAGILAAAFAASELVSRYMPRGGDTILTQKALEDATPEEIAALEREIDTLEEIAVKELDSIVFSE